MGAEGESPRVLVVVQGERDRELLIRRLEGKYRVVSPDDGSLPAEFDCVVVDDRAFGDIREALGRRRTLAEPVALPVLLLARQSDRGADPWVRFRDAIGDVVDDVATLPLGEGELDVRLSSLLRTRRMSRTLEDRRAALERYERIVETTDEHVFATDADWTIRSANRAMLDFHDASRGELIGEPVLDLILEEEEGQIEEVGDRLREGETVTLTTRVADGSGGVRVFEPRLAPMFDDGAFSGVVGVARDVTENRHLEADLREERELLANLFETSPVAITVLNTDGEVVRANERAKDVLRLDPSEIVGREFDAPGWEIFDEGGGEVSPEDLPFARVMRTGEPVFGYEHGIRSPDGEEVWLSINAAPLVDDDGDVVNVVAVLEDVSERVQRERERERERARLSSALDAADAGVWEWDPAADEVTWDDRTHDVFGMGPGEFDGTFVEVLEHIHPADVAEVEAVVADALETGTDYEIEYRAVLPAGRVRWINSTGTVVTDDAGDVDRLIGTVRDVTERVERERQLEDEQTRLSLALDAAGAGVWTLDPETDAVTWDERTQELHGYDPGGFDGTYESAARNIDREDLQEVEERIERVLETGGSYEVEYRVRHPSDGLVWIESHASVLLDDEGDPERIIGIVRDVTDRVERERQLERTVDLFDRTQDIANIGGWEIDMETGDVRWMQGVYDILEVPHGEEPSLEEALGFYPDDDRQRVREGIEQAVETGDPFDLEVQVDAASGRKWVRVRGEAVRREDREPLVRGTFQDITDRKTYEQTLERFETIVQTAADPIFATDAEGRFTLVNDALVALTDHSRMELIGRGSRDAIWDVDGYDHDAMVADLLSGSSTQFTSWVETAAGPVREFAVSVTPLFDGDEYRGAVGVARDITDVRERERRLSVLDRVLRHNLRNKLNLVLAYADAIGGQATDPEVGELGTDIAEVTEELLDISQKARAFEASVDPTTGAVETVDLTDRLASAVEAVRSAHPDAEYVVDAPETAPVRASVTIELAIEELLTNAVVHADDPRPTVEVGLERDGGEYRLRVADEGPGIGPVERAALTRGEETQLEHSTGLGLWLVRWTVTAAGGRLEIHDRDPRGTEIVVALPVADEQTQDLEADGG